MFIILLKFSDNKSQAGAYMASHNEWLKRGFDDGAFLVAGTIEPKQGGCIVTTGVSYDALDTRVKEDPFVAEDVVRAEILEITPSKTDERLNFLLD